MEEHRKPHRLDKKKVLTDCLMGFGGGALIELIFPDEIWGGPSSTLVPVLATQLGIKYDSKLERIPRGSTVYASAVIGQAIPKILRYLL